MTDEHDKETMEVIDEALEGRPEDADDLLSYAKLMRTCACSLREMLEKIQEVDA